jgi:hypothetical protein
MQKAAPQSPFGVVRRKFSAKFLGNICGPLRRCGTLQFPHTHLPCSSNHLYLQDEDFTLVAGSTTTQHQ